MLPVPRTWRLGWLNRPVPGQSSLDLEPVLRALLDSHILAGALNREGVQRLPAPPMPAVPAVPSPVAPPTDWLAKIGCGCCLTDRDAACRHGRCAGQRKHTGADGRDGCEDENSHVCFDPKFRWRRITKIASQP